MSLPPNFSQAVDLSSLGKPAPDMTTPLPGIEVTPLNLQAEVLPLSKTKPAEPAGPAGRHITKAASKNFQRPK